MDILKLLGELREERDRLSEAIFSLERLASGRARRRGRPPAWLAAVDDYRLKAGRILLRLKVAVAAQAA